MLLSEWRKANGYGGRGRPSQAEMAARKASGLSFEKTVPTSTRQATPRASVASVPTARVKTSPTKEVLDVAQPSWGEDITYKDSQGKTISPNEVCHNCGYSMRYCKHPVPVALGSSGKRDIITRYRDGKEYLGALAYFSTPPVENVIE